MVAVRCEDWGVLQSSNVCDVAWDVNSYYTAETSNTFCGLQKQMNQVHTLMTSATQGLFQNVTGKRKHPHSHPHANTQIQSTHRRS